MKTSTNGRSSPDSLNGEDPLSYVPSTSLDVHGPKEGTPQQSRIAVVLKASPSSQFNKNEFRGAHLFSRDKRQTPVPLREQVGSSTSTPAINASLSRGRPKGWRPGMSYSAMRGGDLPKPAAKAKLMTAAAARSVRQVKAKPPPSGYAKRRGRPPKAPSPLPRQVYQGLNTPFVAFLCEWEGCKAELHNLDTLRRHVYAIHSYDGPTVCQWGKCRERGSHAAFADWQAFRAHVEETHLVPFSWHVGDGPQNSGGHKAAGEDEIPDYLKDAEGNQVTPSIGDQEVEDFVAWRNNRRKLKELLMRMNGNLPSEGSDTPDDDD